MRHKRNSCQLNTFPLQPPLCEFVLVISFLLSVPTADVRYVLAFPQCYPAIPASTYTLVLAAWIKFKVGTPTIRKTFPISLHFDTHHPF